MNVTVEPQTVKIEESGSGGGFGRHRIAIFATVGLALLMSSLDGTIVATALRTIQHDLHTSINWASWVITAYSVGLVLALSVSGKLSDRLGRRRFFIISVVIFATSSLLCGLAPNIYVLIVLRAIQAVGGSGFTPSATGIIVENFGSARDKAVGLFGTIFPVGAMVGPIFGGLFVTYWTWRGIFFVNVPIGALLILCCLRFVPADREDDRRKMSVDPKGMALLGVGVVALMLAISFLGEKGGSAASPLFIVPGLVGVIAVWQFGRHIHRTADPLIPPRFITGRGFGAVNAVNFIFGGAVGGLGSLVPLYAVERYKISALGSGTLLTARGVAVIVVSSFAAMALRRTGYRLPLYVGACFIAAGMAGLAFHPVGLSPFAWLATSSCLVGIGAGVSSPATRNAGLQLVPDRSASLAAMRSTGLQVGNITAVSVTTALLAQSAMPGLFQGKVYLVFAVFLVLCMPIISRIPEHRGSW